jgi:hypothetical protein
MMRRDIPWVREILSGRRLVGGGLGRVATVVASGVAVVGAELLVLVVVTVLLAVGLGRAGGGSVEADLVVVVETIITTIGNLLVRGLSPLLLVLNGLAVAAVGVLVVATVHYEVERECECVRWRVVVVWDEERPKIELEVLTFIHGELVALASKMPPSCKCCCACASQEESMYIVL